MKKLVLVFFLIAGVGLQVLANEDSGNSVLARLEKLKAFVKSTDTRFDELEKRITGLEERPSNFTCKVFSKARNVSAYIAAVSVSIPDGYTLTGGGCSNTNPALRKIVRNYRSSDNTWHCATQDHGTPSGGRVTVHAIGCKMTK